MMEECCAKNMKSFDITTNELAAPNSADLQERVHCHITNPQGGAAGTKRKRARKIMCCQSTQTDRVDQNPESDANAQTLRKLKKKITRLIAMIQNEVDS
jgi:hypothetical protein